jgi:hypothetical protein
LLLPKNLCRPYSLFNASLFPGLAPQALLVRAFSAQGMSFETASAGPAPYGLRLLWLHSTEVRNPISAGRPACNPLPLSFHGSAHMQASVEIRRKLAALIGNLISRCIRGACMIPHVLGQEEVVSLLVSNPELYERLVQNEHRDKTELSKTDLTVNVDVTIELEKLDRLESLAKSCWDGPETDLSHILDLTNQLTRTFAVYLGNAATLFDREFEDFMNKFRRSLERAGMTLKTVDFTLEDAEILESSARSYLTASEFLQAFTFDRLLSSQIMMKQVVNLPSTGFFLRENLIRYALEDPGLSSSMIKFALRASYISQGAWEDLFSILLRLANEEPGLCSSTRLVESIEQDVVFSCNLLRRSYAEIREWTAVQRKSAFEKALKEFQESAGMIRPVSLDP